MSSTSPTTLFVELPFGGEKTSVMVWPANLATKAPELLGKVRCDLNHGPLHATLYLTVSQAQQLASVLLDASMPAVLAAKAGRPAGDELAAGPWPLPGKSIDPGVRTPL